MNERVTIVGVLLFALTIAVGANETNEHVVKYYVELINNRTEEALKYEFPSDARMYQSKDEVRRGKVQFH